MFSYVVFCFQIFFIVLEVIILLYMIQSLFYMGDMVRFFLVMLMFPMLYPMQKLVKHSVLGTFSIDLSPYILLIILNYLGKMCEYLLG